MLEEEPDYEFRKESVVTMTATPTGNEKNARITSSPRTNGNSITKREREFFVTTMLPPRVREKLNQKYGKENLQQCFKSQACLRLVLLPLLRSHFLQEGDWKKLASVSHEAAILTELVRDYFDVDFQDLRGYYRPPEDMETIPAHRVRMASAALIHFDGDMAALVRWIGGTHIGAHRDPEKILQYLQGKINAATYKHLARIYRQGVPGYCNAEASEENFQAFLRYGNHASATEDSEKTLKALLKDFKNSYCLLFDKRLVHFTLNCHLTPQGLIGLENPMKKPRPIFDSSFRPYPWCHAINDWTHKDNEPPITFPSAWSEYLQWIYNLRISYPEEEIYPADDDVSGAFRQLKYHPNMVAMHSYQVLDYMAAATGATFGDCTSPSNWDPVAQARRQLAQFLWKEKDLVSRATPHLPRFTLAPKPQTDEVRSFTRANPDSKNKGVFDTVTGQRLPPPYPHHVDDNMYADVAEHITRSIAASVLALFEVVGYPSTNAPSLFNHEKFDGKLTHQRKTVGRHIDTRRLEVSVVPDKKVTMLATVTEWLSKTEFTLREISSLHGSLESLTTDIRWARPLFFGLQNTIRRVLVARYHVLQRWYNDSQRVTKLQEQLPESLLHRCDALIARDKAMLLWSSRRKIPISRELRESLQTIQTILADPLVHWATPIAHLIPRDHHFESVGDASTLGGGAHCQQLQYWFDVVWSEKVCQATKLAPCHHDFVHINCLEFVVVILQVAAAIEFFRDGTNSPILRQFFPQGVPDHPIMLCQTDNTSAMAWANRLSAASTKSQGLIAILAALLRKTNIGLTAEHIPGETNILAVFISRPSNYSLLHPARTEQIFQQHELLRTWRYFRPSPKLVRLLNWSLFNKLPPGLPSLPKTLGQFVLDASTISCSCII
jgi:hypothetical protein